MYAAQCTRVTAEIATAGDGREPVLTHEGVAPEYEARTIEGWTGILDGLGRSLD